MLSKNVINYGEKFVLCAIHLIFVWFLDLTEYKRMLYVEATVSVYL